MRLHRSLGLAAAATTAVMALGALPAAAAETSNVSVLHAVPGVTVDVYANGQKLIPDFTPGTLAGPLSVPAGSYDLAIFPKGTDPASGQPAASAQGVAVPAGANASVVAYLDGGGKPTLKPFVNDTTPIPAGQARLVVRHVAQAPAVDIRAGGTPVIRGLENGQEAALTVPAGKVSADAVLAGTDTVALGPADLTLPEGKTTVVYAWGSQQAGFTLATQEIGGSHSAPAGVPGGSGGLVDDGLPLPLVGLVLTGLAVAAVSARRFAAARG